MMDEERDYLSLTEALNEFEAALHNWARPMMEAFVPVGPEKLLELGWAWIEKENAWR